MWNNIYDSKKDRPFLHTLSTLHRISYKFHFIYEIYVESLNYIYNNNINSINGNLYVPDSPLKQMICIDMIALTINNRTFITQTCLFF